MNKIADLSLLWNQIKEHGGVVRLLVDHPDQISLLEDFESKREIAQQWSVFVKINGGQK